MGKIIILLLIYIVSIWKVRLMVRKGWVINNLLYLFFIYF